MVQPALPLRVLLAAAPSPRTDALCDALEAHGDAITISWVRPTLEALAARLAEQGEAPVHLLYLDGAALLAGIARAEAALWPEAQVALTVLVAAAAPDDQAIEGDLLVLPDGLSASAYGRLFAALINALMAGASLQDAVAESRPGDEPDPVARWLSAGPAAPPALHLRAASPLAPWLEPAPSAAPSKVIRFPSPGLAPAWRRLPAEPTPGALPPEPLAGWVERPAEQEALREALEQPVLAWLCGYEGIGKTSLAACEARRAVRRGLVQRVAYTSFAAGPQPEMALYDLGVTLLGEAFSLSEADPLASVREALAQAPTLVIWDDVDRIAPAGAWAYGADARRELANLAGALRGAGARLLLIASGPDLPDGYAEFGAPAGVVRLAGMSSQEALRLIGQVAAYRQAPLPEVARAGDLAELVGRNPLALVALGSFLPQRSLDDVLAGLRRAFPDLTGGEAALRNQGLFAALEFRLREPGPLSGERVNALGVMVGDFLEPLAQQAMEIDEATWAGIFQVLTAAGLARPLMLPTLTVPLWRLHPALAAHLSRRLPQALRTQVSRALAGEYLGYLVWLGQVAARDARTSKALFIAEMANLRQALSTLLEAHQLDAASTLAGRAYPFLRALNLRQENDHLNTIWRRDSAADIPAEGPLSREGVQYLLRQGEGLASDGRLDESAALLQTLCQRMSAEKGLAYAGDEAALDRGVAFHRLGRVLRQAGQLPMADGALRVAEQALRETSSAEARAALVGVGASRAELMWAGGQAEEAQRLAESALALATELGDRSAVGALHMQLADISLGQNRAGDAHRHLHAALEAAEATQDHAAISAVWTQLAQVAWRVTGDLQDAEAAALKALAAAHEGKLAQAQGDALLRLAGILDAAGKPREAETRLTEAIALYRANGVPAAQLAAEVMLGELLLRGGRLDDARRHAREVRVLADERWTGERPGGGPATGMPWQACAFLERVAEAEGDRAAMAEWRSRGQLTFAGSQEAAAVRAQWADLIAGVARGMRGEALSEETASALEDLDARPEWRTLAETLWKLLRGEAGPETLAPLDNIDFVVVMSILQAARQAPEGESPPASAPPASAPPASAPPDPFIEV